MTRISLDGVRFIGGPWEGKILTWPGFSDRWAYLSGGFYTLHAPSLTAHWTAVPSAQEEGGPMISGTGPYVAAAGANVPWLGVSVPEPFSCHWCSEPAVVYVAIPGEPTVTACPRDAMKLEAVTFSRAIEVGLL
jgi:hypothetical protein